MDRPPTGGTSQIKYGSIGGQAMGHKGCSTPCTTHTHGAVPWGSFDVSAQGSRGVGRGTAAIDGHGPRAGL